MQKSPNETRKTSPPSSVVLIVSLEFSRWRVSEVCDFEWHHYTINLDGDQATLYIDGKAAPTADIVDDWPIHKNIHVGNETTTVVGACWQAKQSHMAMHFKG